MVHTLRLDKYIMIMSQPTAPPVNSSTKYVCLHHWPQGPPPIPHEADLTTHPHDLSHPNPDSNGQKRICNSLPTPISIPTAQPRSQYLHGDHAHKQTCFSRHLRSTFDSQPAVATPCPTRPSPCPILAAQSFGLVA
ncbi:hypothetical protein FA15DRAFT_68178 [Coprinopsis marcescibilis]|uniref:Uncharacterized protein n=1 Tax=Coprinopsis marcescibilis TaxID=230819 RepID=A0A5C3KNE1_COPMA|nr:hypothetical protein FA15DRAFT_68178 [Coprinopsis marcescibilis]